MPPRPSGDWISYGPRRDPAESDMLFRGWRRAFHLFRPVEDDVDLLERSSRRVLDHQESPAVRRYVVVSVQPRHPKIRTLKQYLRRTRFDRWSGANGHRHHSIRSPIKQLASVR